MTSYYMTLHLLEIYERIWLFCAPS